eukprot:scaffold41602_cov55-Phaeocystis_antarctica.AAC.1
MLIWRYVAPEALTCRVQRVLPPPRQEATSSGDPHSERPRDPRPIDQIAYTVYQVDLLTAEGKLKEDAACAVAGAVTIRHRSNKDSADANQPGCKRERPQSSCDGWKRGCPTLASPRVDTSQARVRARLRRKERHQGPGRTWLPAMAAGVYARGEHSPRHHRREQSTASWFPLRGHRTSGVPLPVKRAPLPGCARPSPLGHRRPRAAGQ